jgi:hypothetical protein
MSAVRPETFHHKRKKLLGDDQVARRVPEAPVLELIVEVLSQF